MHCFKILLEAITYCCNCLKSSLPSLTQVILLFKGELVAVRIMVTPFLICPASSKIEPVKQGCQT
jgi:hypothetical protein